jgi:hypothetical protein
VRHVHAVTLHHCSWVQLQVQSTRPSASSWSLRGALRGHPFLFLDCFFLWLHAATSAPARPAETHAHS